jgi:SAM-dependent methyltransferase
VKPLLHLDAVPPIQNRFFDTRQKAQNFTSTEIEVLWCELCQHVSIEKMHLVEFNASYDNTQTASQFAINQYRTIVCDIEQQIPDKDSYIVEIGCGRGDILDMLKSVGYQNIKGFDPAAPFETEIISNKYWDSSVSKIQDMDLVIVRHTIEEMIEPDTFIELVVNALKPNGRIYCEITNISNLLNERVGIFSFYPEYSNLFSSLSISKLFARNGLSVEKITSINNGEWLGVWATKNRKVHNESADSYLSTIRRKLLDLPKPIVLWGAAGRGGNILSFLKISLNEIEFVVDMNTAKQELFIPPFGQRVISPDQLDNVNAKTVLVSNKKYKNEISKLVSSDCMVITIDDCNYSDPL